MRTAIAEKSGGNTTRAEPEGNDSMQLLQVEEEIICQKIKQQDYCPCCLLSFSS